MRYHIEIATPEHIEAMRGIVREADREELWVSAMQTPERVMKRGLDVSDFALTGFADDKPVCMWGVVGTSFIGNAGTPWMVGTKYLDQYARPFLRHCRGMVMAMLQDYDMLQNHVDARNVKAIAWLRWVGFKVNPTPEPYGLFKMPFYRFSMEKVNV